MSSMQQLLQKLKSNKGLTYLGMGVISLYLTKQWANGGRCTYSRDMQGKTVLVTGATRGIGLLTAKDLASRGAKVIFAGRSASTREVVEKLQIELNNKNLEYLELDLSDLESVRRFSENFKSKHQSLDILINNAGIYNSKFALTKDNFESNFGTNHLGHFLLTTQLLDVITSTPHSRIIILASRAHLRSNALDLKTINDPPTSKISLMELYGKSKLANVLFAKELARRLAGTQTKVVSLHPGVVYTSLFDNTVVDFPGGRALSVLLHPFFKLFMKNEFYGAQTTLTCCYKPFDDLVQGGYYSDNKPTNVSKLAESIQAATELWDYSNLAVNK